MQTSHHKERLAAGLALLTLVPAIVVINFQIYWVRHLFIMSHPEEAAAKPPTVSGAISDPEIGIPFAMWMSVLGPFLTIAVAMIAFLIYRDWKKGQPSGQPSGQLSARFMGITGGVLTLAQAVATVGIFLLSWNRFPEGRDLHMFGSYVYFVGEFVTLLIFGFWLKRVLAKGGDWAGTVLPRATLQFQAKIIWIPIILYPLYLGLFVGKDLVSDALWPLVIQTYVWTELAVMTVTLLYMLGFVAALIRFFRRLA